MNFKGVDICCPGCSGDLRASIDGGESFECIVCLRRYPVILGIPDLRIFADPYIEMEADRDKGRHLAEAGAKMSFAELVKYYYSITPAVTAAQAEQFTRGVLAAEGRAEGAFESWASLNGSPSKGGRVQTRAGKFLEVGCGTGPLLVAAAKRFPAVAGVDISFRWLVVGKKRLEEAGIDCPLICACAEALPLAGGQFEAAAFESAIETVQDQRKAIRECRRALADGGELFVSTPNRYSLGPDPHLGLWAGGFLPEKWLIQYAQRAGAVPPKRNLLSSGSLRTLLTDAGFRRVRIEVPEVAREQQKHLPPALRGAVHVYHLARRLPLTREMLEWVGPQFHAVAAKPKAAVEPPVAPH